MAGADRAQEGDFVAVHYTGTLDDGTVFDSSRDRTPLEFTIGGGMVIRGFDVAVTGLAVGETRKSRIEPEDAYGQWTEDMTIRVERSKLPPQLSEPKLGMQLRLSNGMAATIAEVTDKDILLDANHELAGKHLTFDVELVKLVPGARLQTVMFGAGCFWGVELAFQRVPGVVTTSVGYAQGKKENPSYEEVCDGNTGHAEVVQVKYDPAEVSFEQLLDVFWSRHDPTQLNRQGNDVGTQYRSGIYTYTPEQKRAAEESKAAKIKSGVEIVTEIEEARTFYEAEPYHQQYLSRGGRFGKPQDPSKGCQDPIRCYG